MPRTVALPPAIPGARARAALPLLALSVAAACGGPPAADTDTSASSTSTSTSTGDATTSTSTTGETTSDTSAGDVPEGARIVHSFGPHQVGAYKETFPCVAWTIGNEAPLYVNTVHLSNDGGLHHSNWFVVPDDAFPGDDGYFKCGDRGYNEIVGVVTGSVLFAQSTQSRYETQALPEGAVVKIPARSQVITELHFLNPGSQPLDTELRMAFDLIHPRDVEVVVSPFRLSYEDLDIPAQKKSRQQSECLFGPKYSDFTGHPFDLKLYYVLPHYHYLGTGFTVDIAGGPQDGERIFELKGLSGDAGGRSYDPPLDLSGADGLRFACDFDNWTNKDIGYGVGDQEMCMMLGFADAHALLDGAVTGGAKAVGVDGETVVMEGPCNTLVVPKGPAYTKPSAEEIAAPLYVPPPGPGDSDLPPVKPCVDADPGAAPSIPATLSELRSALLVPSCSFNACHGGATGSAAGLDVLAGDLHAELLGHAVVADAGMPLITPGDPDQSWLYRVLAECAPVDAKGQEVAHMPLNAPTLAPDGLVAALRAWIADGALDN
ncbi:MAG: hypothetical protein H6710_16270 [Myxococcales bacterium]|nr:hypothetical protein [Myxococcales bacterium]